jgi:parvulin-like peptidyl-prolyl isomerase
MLPASLALSPLGEVRRVFGDEFAAAVAELEPGRWAGPIESGFGLHLVFVETREAGRLPALAEVREAVRADWESAQRAEENEAFYRRLRERYQVTVDAREP